MIKESFEKKLLELEAIVKSLEDGSLGLDSSIEKFETGVELYKNCQLLLNKAQSKVQLLTESLSEEDYEE